MQVPEDLRALFVALGLLVALPSTSGLAQPAAGESAVHPTSSASDPNAAIKARIKADQVRLEGEIAIQLAKVRTASDPASAAAAEDRRTLNRKLEEYRQDIVAELAVELAGLPPERHGQAIADFRAADRARGEALQKGAFDELVREIAGAPSAEAKAESYARWERDLRILRILEEVRIQALRRGSPTFQAGNEGLKSATVEDLARLAGEIAEQYIQQPNAFLDESDRDLRLVKREVDQWLKQIERELDVQEFMRLAESGLIVDPTTGQPITGQQRDRVAKNAKLQLIEELRRRGVEPSFLRTIMGWGDSRLDLAQQIESEVRDSDVYRMLDFLNPGMTDADMSKVFTAMANVVQRDVQEVLDWRARLIPEGGGGGVSGTAYEWFVAKQKVGLGMAIKMYSGEIDNADARIQKLVSESDAVVKAFQAAANTPNPKDLPADQHKLLETFGYIARQKDGSEVYQLPKGDVTNRLQEGLNLPGASALDAISGANAIKLVIMVALPELAAGRVVQLAEGLEAGAVWIVLLRTGTNVVVGAALDAASQRIEQGKVEWDKLVIESLLVGGAQMGAAEATAAIAKGLVQSPRLSNLLKSEEARQQAEMFVGQALGLTSDVAIQTYWSSKVQPAGVTYEDFLANLLNAAIARGAPLVGRGVRLTVAEAVARRHDPTRLPEWLQRAVFEDAQLKAEVDRAQERGEAIQRRIDEAGKRLLDVVGEDATTKDLTDPAVVAKVTEALESGRLTWLDLKTVFTETMPWALEPFMKAVNSNRLQLFVGIVETARSRARSQLVGETLIEAERIRQTTAEGAPRDAALAELQKRFDTELALINAEIRVPGSDNVTSDIDRSSASPRVRNELKKLTDEAFRANGGRPATSAQAYDVNEYIDVFLIINRMRAKGGSLGNIVVADAGGMTHGQVTEANSMAHAMQHMTPAERAQYRENMIARASDKGLTGKQLDWAEASLGRGERELRQELQRLGVDPDKATADDVIRARDNLYGVRTVKLREMEARYETLDPNSEEGRQLSAQIEREWNFALREGIEAYSDFTGLDIVVNEGQLKKRSIRSLIDDPTFTAQARGYGSEQINGALNNQVGMMVHHMHAFHHGEESAVTAMSAVGKYAERAVMMLKLKGVDVTAGDFKELNDWSKRFVEARKSPEALRAALAEYGGGNEDAGFLKFAALLERTLPGTEGLFSLPPERRFVAGGPAGAPGASPLAQRIEQVARAREREAERARARLEGGAGGLLAGANREIAELEAERDRIQRAQAADARLEGLYRREDWDQARRLEDQQTAVQQQLRLLPIQRADGVYQGLAAQNTALTAQLEGLKKRRAADAGSSGPTEAEQRRAARLTQIEGQLSVARTRRDQLAASAQEEARRLAGVTGPPPQDAGPLLPKSGSELDKFGEFLLGEIESGKMTFPTDPAVGAAPVEGAAGAGGREVARGEAREAAEEPEGLTPKERAEWERWARENQAWDREQEAKERAEQEAKARAEAEAKAAPTGGEAPRPGGVEEGTSIFPPGEYDRWVSPIDFAFTGEPDPEPKPRPTDEVPEETFQEEHNIVDGGRDPTRQAVVLSEGTKQTDGSAIPIDPGEPVPGGGYLYVAPDIQVFLKGLGQLGNDAVEMQVFGVEPGSPIQLTTEGLVVEPVALEEEAKRRLLEEVRKLAARNPVTARLDAYCVEFLRAPPDLGTVFRIAGPEIQARFGQVRDVLGAGRRLYDAGLLNPDSDPEEYFHSIRQWAIWTVQEKLDETAFGRSFVEATHKNFDAGGQPWTSEVEEMVRGLVPNRYRDIVSILEASSQETRSAPAGTGARP
jgi:hypothetical protein